MFSKIRKRVIVAIICIVGIIIAFQCYKNRNGINIKCNSDYPVSANLVGYRQDDDRWKNYTLGNSKYDMGSSGCISEKVQGFHNGTTRRMGYGYRCRG